MTNRPHGEPVGLRHSTPNSRRTNRPRPEGSVATSVRLHRESPGRAAEPSHTHFSTWATFLEPGDLAGRQHLVHDPAALDGVLPDGQPVVVHFSGELPGDLWLVESAVRLRRRDRPLQLGTPARSICCRWRRFGCSAPFAGSRRLWVAAVIGRGRARLPRPTTADPSGTATWSRLAHRALPERVLSRAGERRDAQRDPTVHRRGRHRPGHTGVVSRRCSCTPGSRRSSAANPPTRSATPSADHGRTGQRHRAAAARSSRSARPSCGRWPA